MIFVCMCRSVRPNDFLVFQNLIEIWINVGVHTGVLRRIKVIIITGSESPLLSTS